MTHLKLHSLKALFTIIVLSLSLGTYAQDWKTEKRFDVLFGLAQPVLAKGFNIEGDYINNRFIFDYSHGASLDFSGKLVPTELRKQNIAIHEPWTTGFGVGYRLKEWLNVRAESKWHKFEYYYDGEPQNAGTQITSYQTFTMGVGVYGSYQPFKKKDNFLKGFLISPSVRFWPTVSSSLKNDKFTYLNKTTNTVEEIKTLDAGSNFSPIVVNISVGYSFQLKKKR
ncbi:hypothetical protein EWM62_00200 [Mucilaginibacter terrigena]|uniref:DUF3575 domain-containing protein n=1 Tax=Mucilaginibacter terrigena TaxID=2492395 RepID=A0A4V1ZC97_9SPHI|nr:hypothetical protein [Mucilaginibacter terrigena]RYU91900.1 hypothetical protein EWM62_00200 [Mucilaginibacter terrigena]